MKIKIQKNIKLFCFKKLIFISKIQNTKKIQQKNHFPSCKLSINMSKENLENFNVSLMLCSRYGNLDQVKLAVANGASVRTHNNASICWASYFGHYEIVKFLVEKGADIHVDNEYPLRTASTRGHYDVVKFLLEHGANIHANEDEAFRFANCSYDDPFDVVKLLVDSGANIHANDDQGFVSACYFGHYRVAKFLIQQGANIHANHNNAIRQASQSGHVEIVKLLVENGADKSLMSERDKLFISFCEKIEKKKRVEAVNKIGTWWIPFCYNLNRESGKRMMERSWQRVEEMFHSIM